MFYPLNVGAEKLAAQEPVLGGEGPALPSRVGLVVITRGIQSLVKSVSLCSQPFKQDQCLLWFSLT